MLNFEKLILLIASMQGLNYKEMASQPPPAPTLPWSHSSPETALSKGPTTRQCQTQRALSLGSPAAFDSADHSSLETLLPSFHYSPLPCFSATSPAVLSASPLDLFPWPVSERPQMSQASQKFVSNYKADDYESKHMPGSLFGANTRAVYPTASWAVCWTGLTPSIPHIPPCLFSNSQFSGSGFPRQRLSFYYGLDYSQDGALKHLLQTSGQDRKGHFSSVPI